jgi:dihydroneopterin aldolase
MPMRSTIELSGLELPVSLGTYGPGDVVPETHLLDCVLEIEPSLVLIDTDTMARVFDYDPLVARIEKLAREHHYETQEHLITRIMMVCAHIDEIKAVELMIYKAPVFRSSGQLGVRLAMSREELDDLRSD